MNWIRRHPVGAFFLGTMAFSWACWIPYAAARVDRLPATLPAELVWLGEFGPSLVALLLATVVGGGRGLRALLGALARWRVHPDWYAFALLVTPAAVVVAGFPHADAARRPLGPRRRIDGGRASVARLSRAISAGNHRSSRARVSPSSRIDACVADVQRSWAG